jgi:hypothetical protein
MARDISFLQYMRAHGNTPGPTQRPYLNGAISGFLAAIPSFFVLHFSGALDDIENTLSSGTLVAISVYVGLMVLAGIVYAAVFKRAANDRQGGWLFGISYGFLLWVIGPVTIWQTISNRPVATGRAAMGLFGAQVLFGVVLGLLFPAVHSFLQARLVNLDKNPKEMQETVNKEIREHKKLPWDVPEIREE